ncbi:hypothetical protein [Aureimonas sp. AU40]|uniref:hypothetical protein n=1 Tax=Aureimonas sp. AU40 TaxID=1637747 RepID=UPI000A41FDE0|nr:hypothetical protein [Aureimonas sp. AU40]
MSHLTAGFAPGLVGASNSRASDAHERLKPAKGILLGLAISSGFWAGLAVLVLR